MTGPDAPSILARLRDGAKLSAAEMNWFAQGLANGQVSDAQAGAFAMAVFLNGLTDQERVDLTLAMRDSGDVLKWDLPGPVIDKHSTGGIGDCVSLPLAAALAACGGYVPMISGRGLGHTGGTLDKLEAIPGYSTDADEARLRQIVDRVGCAIVSASGRIAPADKRLYAVRDVTGTVETRNLIVPSILSKKLAAGLQSLVLDVKLGSGAFMRNAQDARDLATALVTTANGAGCKTTALITDMNQPCVPSVGNAVEIAEVVRMLRGETRGVLRDLTIALGADVLAGAGLASSLADGEKMISACLDDGRAAEVFAKMISEQGGPADLLDRADELLPKAPVVVPVPALQSGHVSALDGVAVGQAVVHLGGGRLRDGDPVDPAVGLTDVLPLGTVVEKGDPLAFVHARNQDQAAAAISALEAAITIGDPATIGPLIIERIV